MNLILIHILGSLFYYYESRAKFDEAFVKLVQMTILASNKVEDKKIFSVNNLFTGFVVCN